MAGPTTGSPFRLIEPRQTRRPEIGMLALDSFLPLRELSLQRVRLRTTSFSFGYHLDAAAPCAGPDLSGFVPSDPIARFPIRNTEQEGRGIADENLHEGSMQFWLLPHGWCVAGAVRVFRRRRGQRLKC
jgi:hypothetical protein